MEFDPVGDGAAGEVEEGGHEVLEVDGGIDVGAGWGAGAGDDEGDAEGGFVHVLLAHEAVVADGEAVVAGEEDPGAGFEAGGGESVEDAADLGVQVSDEGEVFAAVELDGGLGAGEGGEALVAKIRAGGDGLGVGVEGEEVAEGLDASEGVAVEVLGGGLAGVVWGVEGDVGEEGAGVGGGRLEGFDGVVSGDFGPVAAALPVAAEGGVGGVPGVGAAVGGGAVVGLGTVLGHAGADVAGVVEDLLHVGGDVPLAGEGGVVAVSGEELGQEAALLDFLIKVREQGLGARRGSGR